MERILTGAALSLLLISLAWGGSRLLPPGESSQCQTRHDLERHLDRSRNGISLTCTEAILRADRASSGPGVSHESR